MEIKIICLFCKQYTAKLRKKVLPTIELRWHLEAESKHHDLQSTYANTNLMTAS